MRSPFSKLFKKIHADVHKAMDGVEDKRERNEGIVCNPYYIHYFDCSWPDGWISGRIDGWMSDGWMDEG